MRILTSILLATAITTTAHAQSVCVPKSMVESRAANKGIKLELLTKDQWQFLRGIYAMHPETPPGLPYGESAYIAKNTDGEGGAVYFVDGDLACTPMPVPTPLIKMLDDIAKGVIHHEGAGL